MTEASGVRHPVRLDVGRAERELRHELHHWLRAELPAELRANNGLPDHLPEHQHRQAVEFCRRLHARGWFVPHWPAEFEGGGRSIIEQVIIREELAYANAPLINGNATNMLAPVLFRYGTDVQRQRHLPAIARTEELWAQGYSEPDAGSDLASIRMTARRDGDVFVLDGQKTWTSNGSRADWIFVLAKTDTGVKPQAGISFFLVDMTSPGITMRPIRSAPGYSTFAEEFFDSVRVPAANLVGAENDGWRVAKSLLDSERTNIVRAAQAQRLFDELIDWCRTQEGTTHDPRRDPVRRDTMARLAERIAVGRSLSYRIAILQATGALTPAHAALSKLFWSQFAVEMKFAAAGIVGQVGQLMPDDPNAVLHGACSEGVILSLLHQIGGGTNEVQRNVVGEVGLGLPKEPK